MAGDLIWIKGAGDLATGVAYRLWMAGFRLAISELAEPLCVRRAVSLAEAVYQGRHVVEGMVATRVASVAEAVDALQRGEIPVVVDPEGQVGRQLGAAVVVDAIMAKRNTGTRLEDAPVVIGLGPGFTVGVDVHAVVETQRGHYLGRALYQGQAAADTGIPGEMGGVAGQRVVRAPATGRFEGWVPIGETVQAGDRLGQVRLGEGALVPVIATVGGVLRGLMHDGVLVPEGVKVGDIDPTGERGRCYTISDKALAVGGGVLEAVLHLG